MIIAWPLPSATSCDSEWRMVAGGVDVVLWWLGVVLLVSQSILISVKVQKGSSRGIRMGLKLGSWARCTPQRPQPAN